jgi:hypothetical protein
MFDIAAVDMMGLKMANKMGILSDIRGGDG